MSDMSKVEYTGLTISSPLFFNSDESIDYLALGRYLDDVCANEYVGAVYSMAYNTRYRMLDDNEVYEVNKFIIERVKSHGKQVYVGHPYVFTRKTLEEYFQKLSNLPVDGVSMLYPERYYGVDEPIIDFLQMPKNYGLNVVLHEMKLVSGFNGELINWPESLLTKVFKQVDLVAVKEDSKDDDITDLVLNLCKEFDVHCVLAGGGKVRAQKFFTKGLTTWLNGSTMFVPQLIDEVYKNFTSGNSEFIDWYLATVESPFFENVVAKYGWHLAHKVALEYFGYGHRYERFPHAAVSEVEFSKLKPLFEQMSNEVKNFIAESK
jgi:dihydrodipicolinate synthase/N-acetylneuraminate lyase